MRTKNKPIITITLIILNAVIYLGIELSGEMNNTMFFLEHGAMYGPYVLENGEYYRLFTSMFLHFDFYHLVNNMFMLGAFGLYLEPEYGKFKFLITYLFSGLCGNLLSLAIHATQSAEVISAGASGAIYGTMGIMAALVLKNYGSFGKVFGKRIFLMIALCLYYGFTGLNVDNYAHIGGLIGGFLMAMLLYRGHKSRQDQDPYGYEYYD